MKKTCLLIAVLFLAGCSSHAASSSPSASTKTGGMLGLANPWCEGSTLQEAAAGSGVSFTIADPFPFAYDNVIYRWMTGTIEVRYSSSDQEINLRKSTSSDLDSISGDYNVYEETTTVTVNEDNVTLAGNQKKWNKAEWKNSVGVYSITVNPGTDNGLSLEQMESLIKAVK